MDIVEREQLNLKVVADHWYYESKYQLLKMHLHALPLRMDSFRTADVGTGLGLFLHKMELDGLASPSRSAGIDPGYSVQGKVFESGIPIYPSFPNGEEYDLMLLMDVLEHVEDDMGLLRDVIQHMEDPGYIFITVPALPMLWSGHDRFLGQFRRYTLSSLQNLILDTGGMEIINLHYHFASILPFAIPIRLANSFRNKPKSSDMRPIPTILNQLLKKLCMMELKYCQKNRSAGLSAVALCKKK